MKHMASEREIVGYYACFGLARIHLERTGTNTSVVTVDPLSQEP